MAMAITDTIKQDTPLIGVLKAQGFAKWGQSKTRNFYCIILYDIYKRDTVEKNSISGLMYSIYYIKNQINDPLL